MQAGEQPADQARDCRAIVRAARDGVGPQPGTGNPQALDAQIGTFIDQHRRMLATILDSLTEEDGRGRLFPSKTPLLRLVKHTAFAKRVWFGEAVIFASRGNSAFPLHQGSISSWRNRRPTNTVESKATISWLPNHVEGDP